MITPPVESDIGLKLKRLSDSLDAYAEAMTPTQQIALKKAKQLVQKLIQFNNHDISPALRRLAELLDQI